MSDPQFDSVGGDFVQKFKNLPDGSLLAWLRVARTGELDYGSHKQIVPAETLFDSDSMRSLVGVPVTLEHPPGMVLSLADRRKHSVGTVLQEIVQETHDGDNPSFLTAAALIWDEPTILALEKGQFREVSSGYFATKEPVQDSPSLFRQTRREYNHLALTGAGRAGAEVRILMDSQQPTVAELVALHQAHRDSLIAAGITPDYSWDKLTLLQKAVTARFNRDASALSLSECQAVLDFIPSPASTTKPNVPSPVDIEADYMKRLTTAYKKL
jgi:hypothetical protein